MNQCTSSKSAGIFDLIDDHPFVILISFPQKAGSHNVIMQNVRLEQVYINYSFARDALA